MVNHNHIISHNANGTVRGAQFFDIQKSVGSDIMHCHPVCMCTKFWANQSSKTSHPRTFFL